VTDAETDTDDRGEYRFGGLSAGRYRVQAFGRPEAALSAIPTATLPAQVAETRRMLPNASPTSDAVAVDVRAGMLTPATLVYYEGTVILPYALVGGMVSGHLVDELGEPAEGVSVQLWRTRFMGSRRVLEAFGASRRTDDRGEYRLFHIPPGPYVVVASDHSWQAHGVPSSPWLPVFYPGTTSPAEATPLQIGRSQELSGTNVLFVRNRGSRVFGAAIDSDGQPLQTRVSLRPSSRQRGFVLPGWTATTNADGTFEFDGVPPGDHVIQVAPNVGIQAVPAAGPAGERAVLLNAPARPSELAVDRVTVSGADLGPLLVATVPTATIRGTVVFEGIRPAGELFVVAAVAADPDFTPSTAAAFLVATSGIDPTSAKFEMKGLGIPVRLVLSSAPRGWWLKAADVGPFNAALEPAPFKTARDSRDDVTLVLADTAAAIAGVVDGQGSAVEGCWIVAFATDPERWFVGSPYVRAVTADQKGRFAVSSLPPGDYWIAAVFSVGGDADSGEWQHAEFLEALALTARRINLGAKQQLTLAQRLVPTDR
jgi:protocatechuate 3,4-dioxygenase beta subunit